MNHSESCLPTYSLFQAPRKCLEIHEKKWAFKTVPKCSSQKGFKKADVQIVSMANSPYYEQREACIFSLHQGAMSYGSYEGKKEKKLLTDTIRDIANSENMIHFIYFSIYVISTIGYIRNSQWLALQLL